MRQALTEWRSLIDSYQTSGITQGEISVDREGFRGFFDVRTAPILDRNSRLIGRLIVLRDITLRKTMEDELRASNEKLVAQLGEINNLHSRLQEQVIRDPLTGLYNRRYLNETLQHVTERATRKQSPLSILMVDIDHFKDVNDAYGHAKGDDVLITLCEKLTANVRNSDMIYRYGGDELLILMLDTSLETAMQRAELIRSTLEKVEFAVESRRFPMTVSIGVATLPGYGLDMWEVIDAADNALYEAKINGRNRVECAK
jgi:diguanylate cyclase (GGDEF)-like protein